jgi:hypothetical protein
MLAWRNVFLCWLCLWWGVWTPWAMMCERERERERESTTWALARADLLQKIPVGFASGARYRARSIPCLRESKWLSYAYRPLFAPITRHHAGITGFFLELSGSYTTKIVSFQLHWSAPIFNISRLSQECQILLREDCIGTPATAFVVTVSNVRFCTELKQRALLIRLAGGSMFFRRLCTILLRMMTSISGTGSICLIESVLVHLWPGLWTC